MFPIEKISPIVDLIIDLEKDIPIEKMIDMNCTLANSGSYLKRYLTYKKDVLLVRESGEPTLVGTLSNPDQKAEEAIIYDHFVYGGLPEINGYLKKEDVELLLLLDLREENLSADTLNELLKYIKTGILINPHQQNVPALSKLMQQFDDVENPKAFLPQTQFRLKPINSNIYYLERVFRPHYPIYYFDIIENGNSTYTLTSENSVLEYYVPHGYAFMKLKSGKNKNGGELQIFADGRLIKNELIPPSGKGPSHATCFRLPADCSKIKINLNTQTDRATEKVYLTEVSFS